MKDKNSPILLFKLLFLHQNQFPFSEKHTTHIIASATYHWTAQIKCAKCSAEIRKKGQNKLLNLPKLSFFSEAAALNRTSAENWTPLHYIGLRWTAEWKWRGGESLIRFSNTSPNTRAPHIRVPNASEGREDERVAQEKLAARRWSWREHLREGVDWILLGRTKRTLGRKTDGAPLSSTGSLIKGSEDDNRPGRGLRAVPVWFELQGRPGHCESKLI